MISALPKEPWLVLHSSPYLERSLPWQIWWERFILPRELKAYGYDILLNVDAGSVCRFQPAVTISRDMLSYEPSEISRYGWSTGRLRLIALRYLQNANLRTAQGVIFLTKYAAEVIQRSCGPLSNVARIPHGVGDAFKNVALRKTLDEKADRPIRCLYVSNTLPYKHQWHVVEAVAQLRATGFDIVLEIVGGGEGQAQQRLMRQITLSDPMRSFVILHDFVSHDRLPEILSEADLFVFASSCENMPNTLVEAMAAGLPIACSNRGPMPEVLEDGGLYFDPESSEEIAYALKRLILSPDLRDVLGARAKKISYKYSWGRCAQETFAFLVNTAKQERRNNEASR